MRDGQLNYSIIIEKHCGLCISLSCGDFSANNHGVLMKKIALEPTLSYQSNDAYNNIYSAPVARRVI